jgi:hypothetical protein
VLVALGGYLRGEAAEPPLFCWTDRGGSAALQRISLVDGCGLPFWVSQRRSLPGDQSTRHWRHDPQLARPRTEAGLRLLGWILRASVLR